MESGAVSALDRPSAELTVVDVYDIAALLGHEFERVIDRYGCEAVVGVVPKVVRVLELLEALVNYGGAHNKSEELQQELDRLHQERTEQNRRHQMEMELLEGMWRSEVQDLMSQISLLQSDNKRLQLLSQCAPEQHEHEEVCEKEREVLLRLKELVDKQREELRSKEHALSLKSDDIEALQLQQARVMKMNQDLRHRLTLTEAQGKALVQQRAELEAVAQVWLQELGQLRQDVSRLQRQLQDLEHERMCAELNRAENTAAAAAAAAITGPMPPLPHTADKASSVWAECAGDSEFMAKCFEQVPLTTVEYVEPHIAVLPPERWAGADSGEDTDSSGQETDCPLFTLQELRDVLLEKNQLKAQVFLLQEELAYYKEESEEDLSLSVNCPCEEESPETPAAAEEPESGIRKLIFTAIMPMVAAGLISDDPTLLPIRRLVSIV